ncbi:small, acid-soluble spore protein I [Paenibacillus montaniterrae]|uniref:Small, acid-soluble spore protein I n=1 Tax=Paenibacillus montaniterrae TaxID=429341 RepID=A0A920CUM9_9BACL|nr:small acid-soluble spore protein SspI [Paenibacillus montaniterrae]GIP17197.1 small, acid-soluble spore protein I [Paenibacillus montaniterrae]
MQNLDLRQAIINRIQSNSKNEIHETIDGSCDADERALPGLGVLFEIIWKDSSEAQQSEMVNTLYEHLHADPSKASPSY